MALSPLAGKPAPKQMLVYPSRLEHDYLERWPDPDDPAQQVSFGTSAVAIEYLLTHRPGGEDSGQQRHDRPRRGPPAVRGAGRLSGTETRCTPRASATNSTCRCW